MLVIFSLVLNVIVFSKLTGTLDKNQIILLVSFGLMSIPLGIYALKVVDESLIKLTVGVLIIVSSIAMNFGLKVKFKN